MTDKSRDVNGRAYALADEVKPGDVLECDDGFSCIPAGGTLRTVRRNGRGELYIPCSGPDHEARRRGSRHLLDGQDDGDGILIGLYPV